MPKLNDLQTILLSSASRRDEGSLYPLPTGVGAGPRVASALASLLKAGLVEERETSDLALAHRQDGDCNMGVFVTAAGLTAIGIEPAGDAQTAPEPARALRISKRDNVVALLSRAEGATLAELIAATGWLPHTTRAALTGLRKQGQAIERGKRGETTCYYIAAVA